MYSPSVKILVAFCSEMPLICSRTLCEVYATDSTVLKPPSTISCISRFVRPATPYRSVSRPLSSRSRGLESYNESCEWRWCTWTAHTDFITPRLRGFDFLGHFECFHLLIYWTGSRWVESSIRWEKGNVVMDWKVARRVVSRL